MLKTSMYNIIYKNYLINTFSRCIIKLEPEKLLTFKVNDFSKFNEDEIRQLKENGFLENNGEQIEIIKNEIQRDLVDNFYFILYLNNNCNFRCKYCYENKTNDILSLDKIDELFIFLDKNYPQLKHLQIGLFGGEPTLHLNHLFDVLNSIKNKCEERRLNFNINIVTNFYNITKDIFLKLIDYKVTMYQVTLDGNPEMHNFYRPLLNGLSTFAKIIDNLKAAKTTSKDFIINIRLNFDKYSNYESYFKYMSEIFANDSRFVYTLNEIFPSHNMQPDIKNRVCKENEINKRKQELLSLMKKYKLISNISVFDIDSIMPCYACSKNYLAITSDGNAIKCTTHIEDKANRLGDFLGNRKYENNLYDNPLFSTCETCCLFPICLGRNCRYDFVHSRENCEKKYTNIFMERLKDEEYL